MEGNENGSQKEIQEDAYGTKKGQKILVPVICATRDYQGAAAQTIVSIWNVLWKMGREPAYAQFPAHGYAFVRTNGFRGLAADLKTDKVRGILIDDDIILPHQSQNALGTAITIADTYNFNFVSPYRVKDGYVSIAHSNGQLMHPDEYSQLKPWDRVPNAGLGFYYGDIPLDYIFHEEEPFAGEDLNFFYENPQLDIRQVDLGLRHIKQMSIGLDTQMVITPRGVPTKRPGINSNNSIAISGNSNSNSNGNGVDKNGIEKSEPTCVYCNGPFHRDYTDVLACHQNKLNGGLNNARIEVDDGIVNRVD